MIIKQQLFKCKNANAEHLSTLSHAETIGSTDEIDTTSYTANCAADCSTAGSEELVQCNASNVQLTCSSEDEDDNTDHDIAVAFLKAFQLMEDVNGSQKKLNGHFKFWTRVVLQRKHTTPE